MEGAAKLIAIGFSLGLALAEIGKLPEATRWMMELAAKAQPQMISLSRLNRDLQGGGVTRHHHAARSSESGLRERAHL